MDVHENFLVKVNEELKKSSPKVSDEAVDRYFDKFRVVFRNFAFEFRKANTENERRDLIKHVCDLNSLYAIQLKLNRDLHADLSEVARDFDNPDYPRYDYIEQMVLGNNYLILKDHR